MSDHNIASSIANNVKNFLENKKSNDESNENNEKEEDAHNSDNTIDNNAGVGANIYDDNKNNEDKLLEILEKHCEIDNDINLIYECNKLPDIFNSKNIIEDELESCDEQKKSKTDKLKNLPKIDPILINKYPSIRSSAVSENILRMLITGESSYGKRQLPVFKRLSRTDDKEIEHNENEDEKIQQDQHTQDEEEKEDYENMKYCDYCSFQTTDDVCLNDHIMIYHEGLFNEYACTECDSVYNSINELDYHIRVSHKKHKQSKDMDNDNDEIEDDSDDSVSHNNEYYKLHKWSTKHGKHVCQICSLKFSAQNHLGEHFILNHESYEDQLVLDNEMITTSFPGFEILEVLDYLKCVLHHEHYENCCEICCKEFLVNHNKKMKIVTTSYLDNYDGETRYPVILICCDKLICHTCIKEYLNLNHLNGLIICPYCTKDHTKYDRDYLKITDILCDTEKWKKWWKKNEKIDMLAFS